MAILSLVDVSPVSYPDDKDEEFLVLNAGDNTIITHTIFPEIAKSTPLQRFAKTAWIIKVGDTIGQKMKDATGDLAIKFSQFASS